jgi:hypothetical protein
VAGRRADGLATARARLDAIEVAIDAAVHAATAAAAAASSG